MAVCNCFLQAPPLSRFLSPVFSRRATNLFPGCGQLKSTVMFSSSSAANRTGPLTSPVRAEVKRVSRKESEIASASDLQFETPLKIVEYPDPILRAKNKRIGVFDENLKNLADAMFDVMYKTDGIGLSAPQVGLNVQLMVFNPAGESGEGEEIVLVNPKINKYSDKLVPFNEGCLSFPGIYADVVRPAATSHDKTSNAAMHLSNGLILAAAAIAAASVAAVPGSPVPFLSYCNQVPECNGRTPLDVQQLSDQCQQKYPTEASRLQCCAEQCAIPPVVYYCDQVDECRGRTSPQELEKLNQLTNVCQLDAPIPGEERAKCCKAGCAPTPLVYGCRQVDECANLLDEQLNGATTGCQHEVLVPGAERAQCCKNRCAATPVVASCGQVDECRGLGPETINQNTMRCYRFHPIPGADRAQCCKARCVPNSVVYGCDQIDECYRLDLATIGKHTGQCQLDAGIPGAALAKCCVNLCNAEPVA